MGFTRKCDESKASGSSRSPPVGFSSYVGVGEIGRLQVVRRDAQQRDSKLTLELIELQAAIGVFVKQGDQAVGILVVPLGPELRYAIVDCHDQKLDFLGRKLICTPGPGRQDILSKLTQPGSLSLHIAMPSSHFQLERPSGNKLRPSSRNAASIAHLQTRQTRQSSACTGSLHSFLSVVL